MSSVASVYASSLFSLAQDENKVESIMEELKELSSVFSENADYCNLLDSPIVSLTERLSLIDAAFSDADEYIVNFIKILCEKKCVHLFSDCVKHFEKLYNKANNIEKVTVITAVPLSNSLKEKLISKLEQEYSKKIVPEYKIDKEILGGIIIRTENSQTDASVRSRLDAIKAQICNS